MSRIINRSNSLADLAARINAAHEAAAAALKSSVIHAMQAGDLLIEAKKQVDNGEWLPWLKANFPFSDRTARLYMQVARSRADIEVKLATVADLTLRDVLAEPGPDDSWDPDSSEMKWVVERLNQPFTDSDFESPVLLSGKVMYQAGLPVSVACCLDLGQWVGVDCLDLCPFDDLRETLTILAPYVKNEKTLPINVIRTSALEAWVDLTICTQTIFVAVWEACTRGRTPAQQDRVLEAAKASLDAYQAARRGEHVDFENRKGLFWDFLAAHEARTATE